MGEIWVEATLRLGRFDQVGHKRLILNFVKPVIEDLEDKDVLDTFHFLFEPGPRLLLRIQPKAENNVQEIRETVRNFLTEIQGLIVQDPAQELFTPYGGEAEDFGEDGWMITKRVFEMGSRMAIGKLDQEFRKGRKFEEGKLLHCFLNSIGHGILVVNRGGRPVTSEALFHLNGFLGRMLIIRGKRIMDNDTESEARGLIEEQIQWWKKNPLEGI